MPSNRDILSSIDARTALETPQIIVDWAFKSDAPQVDRIKLNRSTYRFPEDDTEGDQVLDEVQTIGSLRTSFADLTVDPQEVHYYSAFFDVYAPFAQDLTFSQDIERLGLTRAVRIKGDLQIEFVGVGNDVDTNFTGSLGETPIHPGSVTFRAVDTGATTMVISDDGQGNLIGDIGAGTNTIDYDTGAFDLDFQDPVGSGNNVLAIYISGDQNFWVAARDDDARKILWGYNTKTTLVDRGVDLTPALNAQENIVSVLSAVESVSTILVDIVTDERFLRFEIEYDVDDDIVTADADDITSQFGWSTRLPTGFLLSGATFDRSVAGGDISVRVLDASNRRAPLYDLTGTLIRDMDLSGIPITNNEQLAGLAYDITNHYLLVGAGEDIVSIDSDETAPVAVEGQFPLRQRIRTNPAYHNGKFTVADFGLELLEQYAEDDATGFWQMERKTVATDEPTGLWRFNDDEDAVVALDSSIQANDGTPDAGILFGAEGKFNNAIQIVANADRVDLSASAGLIDGDEGFIGFWWKEPYSGYLNPDADVYFFRARADAVNEIFLRLESDGTLRLREIRGGTSVDAFVADASAVLGNGAFHHIGCSWGAAGGVQLYVDGVLLDSDVLAGVFTGPVTIFDVGDSVVGSALGYYDDFVLYSGELLPFTRVLETTRGNRADALSGRDYDSDDPKTGVPFPMRNKHFGFFSERLRRNDYNQTARAPDTELDDGEIIFREPRTDMILGHHGGTARLFGLFLDRLKDREKFFCNHKIPSEVENDFIEQLGDQIDAIDFDEDWNVDQRRLFLFITWVNNQEAMTQRAFKRLVRFLGFEMYCPEDGIPVVVSRRRFDSTQVPEVPDTPFDTGFLDSGAGDFQFVTIQLTFFLEVYTSLVGATSIPATRELTDAGAMFTQTAEPGSLIFIYDVDDPGDNGQYLVDSVINDTTLVVDRDWPEGSNTGLSYRLNWQIPCADPYNASIISRMNKIKARWQALLCTNVDP